ncbi:hypothetical protein [Phytohabitans rumicis]|uniref:Uncharacterized protein n=1 Tax=Phytohabitans rumicis TaxID=1076125 RepID=A0A6V8L0A9_9ACTN|nr:hypothetical protein [Phytohabitans rumicis]GFJ87496.1 hypothetical protein Prum_011380 [Phytohabitans rumicis]
MPGANAASVTVVALASGQSHEVVIHDPDAWAVRDIFPSGDLLLAPRRDHDPNEDSTGTPMPSLTGPYRPNGEPPGFFLAVADGRTGAQRGLYVPMGNGVLGKGDELSTGPAMPLLIAPSGQTLVYQLVSARSGGSGDLLTISAAGQVLDRYRLPSGRGAASRQLAAVRADGAVLITRTGDVITVEVLDLASGRRWVVATAPAGSHLLLAGTTSWDG